MATWTVSPEDFLKEQPAEQPKWAVSPEDFLKQAPQPKQPTSGVPGMEQLGGTPPGPAKPPLPNAAGVWGVESLAPPIQQPPPLNPRTGLPMRQPPVAAAAFLEAPIRGAQEAIAGAEQAAEPAEKFAADIGRTQLAAQGQKPTGPPAMTPEAGRQLAAGTSKILGGAMEATTPLIPGALVSAPLHTVATLVAATAAQKATTEGLKAAGASDEWADFGGTVAGFMAAGGGAKTIYDKVYKAAGSPTVEFGKIETPKEFADMTDAELLAHANKIAQDPPKNADWQKEQIAKEVLKRQAARGMAPGSAQEAAEQPAQPAPATPSAPEAQTEQQPPPAVTIESGAEYETPQGKLAVQSHSNGRVTYDMTMPDGSKLENLSLPTARFQKLIASAQAAKPFAVSPEEFLQQQPATPAPPAQEAAAPAPAPATVTPPPEIAQVPPQPEQAPVPTPQGVIPAPLQPEVKPSEPEQPAPVEAPPPLSKEVIQPNAEVPAAAGNRPKTPNIYGTAKGIIAGGMSIGSREEPLYSPTGGHEVYFDKGSWWYRSADRNAAPFARQWMRVTDPSFSKHLEGELRDGTMQNEPPSRDAGSPSSPLWRPDGTQVYKIDGIWWKQSPGSSVPESIFGKEEEQLEAELKGGQLSTEAPNVERKEALELQPGGAVYEAIGKAVGAPRDRDPQFFHWKTSEHHEGFEFLNDVTNRAYSAPDVATAIRQSAEAHPEWKPIADAALKAITSQTSQANAPKIPATVYHGTGQDFEGFDESKAKENTLYGPGFYFTEDPAVASKYAKGAAPNVRPAVVSISHPFDVDGPADPKLKEILESDAKTNDEIYREAFERFGTKSDVNDWLQANGYDGITHVGGKLAGKGKTIHRVWIAFNPDQVNSAFATRPSVIQQPEAEVSAAAGPEVVPSNEGEKGEVAPATDWKQTALARANERYAEYQRLVAEADQAWEKTEASLAPDRLRTPTFGQVAIEGPGSTGQWQQKISAEDAREAAQSEWNTRYGDPLKELKNKILQSANGIKKGPKFTSVDKAVQFLRDRYAPSNAGAAPLREGPITGQQKQPAPASGEDVIRGSINIPLSPMGQEQASELGQQIAAKGGLDRLESSDLVRTEQTADAIAHAIGQKLPPGHILPVTLTPNLHPMHMGEIEGQPTKQVLRRMNEFITKHPDTPVPGKGENSTQPGESFKSFMNRTLDFMHDQMAAWAALPDPKPKWGYVTHFRVVRLLESWAGHGFKEVDPHDLTTKSDKNKPGSVHRIFLDGDQWKMQPVDMASDKPLEPGIYIIRHGVTAFNGENQPAQVAQKEETPKSRDVNHNWTKPSTEMKSDKSETSDDLTKRIPVLFHGTSSRYLSPIKSDGLKTRMSQEGGKGSASIGKIYFSPFPEIALDEAWNTVSGDTATETKGVGGVPVLIAVRRTGVRRLKRDKEISQRLSDAGAYYTEESVPSGQIVSVHRGIESIKRAIQKYSPMVERLAVKSGRSAKPREFKISKETVGKQRPKSTTPPWEMTKAEWQTAYYDAVLGEHPNDSDADTLRHGIDRRDITQMNGHRRVVQKALEEGKSVPESILKEYPNLKPTSGEVTISEGTKVTPESVSMPSKEFAEEHERLPEVLRNGTPEERAAEADKQAKELEEVKQAQSEIKGEPVEMQGFVPPEIPKLPASIRSEPYITQAPTSVHASVARAEPISLEHRLAKLADAYVVNPSGMELIGRGAARPADSVGPRYAGLHISHADMGALERNLEALDNRYHLRGKAGFDQIWNAVVKANNEGKSLVLINDHPDFEEYHRDAILEEMGHAIQSGPSGKPGTMFGGRLSDFQRLPLYKKAAQYLTGPRGYGGVAPGTEAAEVGVRLMRSGGYAELGLNVREARSLAADYVRTLRREYGSATPREIAAEVFSAFRNPERRGPAKPGTGSDLVRQKRGGGATNAPGSDLSGYLPQPGEVSGEQPRAGQPVRSEEPEVRSEERPSAVGEFLRSETGTSAVGQAAAKIVTPANVPSLADIAKLSHGSEKSAIEAVKKAADGEKSTGFGEKLRTMVTGARDTRVAETNQTRERLQKLVPDHQEQEALTLMRDFHSRPGELKKFLDGSHPAYAEYDLTPEQKAAAVARVQKLAPVIELAEHPTEAMKQANGEITKYFTKTLAEGRYLDFIDSSISNEDYITHLLQPKGPEGEEDQPKPKRFMGRGKLGPKQFSHAKQRFYPTVLHAVVAGVRPRTLNALDALTVYGERYARTAAYRLFESAVKDAALAKWGTVASQKKGAIPANWVELHPQSRLFRHDLAFTDAEGNAHSAHQMMFVPPEIDDAMRPVLDPNWMSRVPFFMSARMYQAYIKGVELGLSFFHLKALSVTGLNNEGLTGLVQSFVSDMEAPEFERQERAFIQAGGTTPILGRTIEAYKALQPSSLPTYSERVRNVPVVKQIDKAANAITRFTFDVVQRKLKVTDFSIKDAAWMAKNPQASTEEHFEAQRKLAKEINAAYGGLQWENMGVHRVALELSRALLLAPDWTFSNVLNLKYTTEGGPGGKAARLFWIRSIVLGLALTYGMSIALSGRKPKDPTQVLVGKNSKGEDIYQNMFFVGAPGDGVTFLNNIKRYGAVVGLAHSIANKFGPIARTSMHLMENEDERGRPLTKPGESVAVKTAKGAREAVRGMAPVPFSVSGIVQMLTDRTHHYTMKEYAATALNGRQPMPLPKEKRK